VGKLSTIPSQKPCIGWYQHYWLGSDKFSAKIKRLSQFVLGWYLFIEKLDFINGLDETKLTLFIN